MSLSKSKSKTAPSAYNKPYLDAAGATLAPTYQAQSEIAKSMQPGLNAAAGYYGDVLGGKYLDEGNPYIDRIVADSNNDITEQVNQQFMPRFGSGYHAKALARELGANEARLRGGEYDRERGYQDSAPRGLLDIAMGATALPGIASHDYAQGVGGLFGQYNKTSTSTPWGPALLQGASNAAAAYFGGK